MSEQFDASRPIYAQLVERLVRMANDMDRPLATPAQAREMMGLGEPRQYS